MKTLYRTSFLIDREGSVEEVFDHVAAVSFRWVFEPRRGIKPPDGLDIGKASSLDQTCLDRGFSVEAHGVTRQAGAVRAWGLRFCHPDEYDSNLRWTTELGLISEANGKPWFSCGVGIGRTDATLIPIRQRSSRPRIVPNVLRHFRCLGAYQLMAKPIVVLPTEADIKKLVDVLQEPRRTHPIVFISARNQDGGYFVDPRNLADGLAGLAHVVVAGAPEVSWTLRNELPNPLVAYDGTVRLYWPGFRASDSPFSHPLWNGTKIQRYRDPSRDLSQALLDVISSTAVFNLHEGVLTWDRLQSLARRQAIDEAKSRGAGDREMMSLLEEDNRQLNSEIATLRSELAAQGEELRKQRNLTDAYRAEFENRKVGQASIPVRTPAESVLEAVERAATELSARLVFAFNSKSEHEGCPYEAPEEVEKAFNWLTTVYWLARTGQKSCPDLDRAIRESVPGWSYSGGQKESTMGQFKAWYQCQWEGRTYCIDEHLRCGGPNRDPRESIRIAFAWDADKKKVVVGFIGQHQRNRNS